MKKPVRESARPARVLTHAQLATTIGGTGSVHAPGPPPPGPPG